MRTVIAGPARAGKTALAKQMQQETGALHLNLDPASQSPFPLGFVSLSRAQNEVSRAQSGVGMRFIGGVSLRVDPILALSAVAWGLQKANDNDVIVELPIARAGGLATQLVRAIIETVHPQKLIALGLPDAKHLLRVPNDCEFIERTPNESVRRSTRSVIAWRRSVWRDTFGNANFEKIPLQAISIGGALLGSGIRLENEELSTFRAQNIRVYRAEIIGDTLTLFSSDDPGPEVAHSLSDLFGCSSCRIVDPQDYVGLLCAMANENGDHFAAARIEEIDFKDGFVKVRTTSEPPSPIACLHIGRLRLDSEGNEIETIRAWQV